MKNSFWTRKINSDYDHISFYSVHKISCLYATSSFQMSNKNAITNKCVCMPQVVFKCRIKMQSQRVFHLFRCVKNVCK